MSALILDIGAHPEIWGQQNKEALICINEAVISANNVRIMGSNQDTIKFTINGIDYIKFKATELIDAIQQMGGYIKLKLICKANINEWLGRQTPQMIIEDCELFPYYETTF